MLMQCQPRPHATFRYPSERGRLGTEREFSRQARQVTSHQNWEQGLVTEMNTLCYCTKIYPMALRSLSPLSVLYFAALPHVFDGSWAPPLPNPILESGQTIQPFSLLAIMPILVFAQPPSKTLNPSMLQLSCKDPSEPRSDFHVSRPSDVARCCPSAISENKESAVLFMRIKWFLSRPRIFIPRQILEKDVFQ